MKNLPPVPSLTKILGPSFILLGLALGSGELVMWPYLSASWGMGIIWGALVGITFQYFLNTEIIRYALYWGESVFVGFYRLAKFLPFWFIFSTFIPWSLPGFSSAAGEIFSRIFGWENQKIFAIFLLLFVGLVLTLGKVLYKTMETIQKTVILFVIPFILFLVAIFTSRQDWLDLAWGMVGRGEDFWFLPAGISIASFLAAVAYAGAGGNLNLAQSYYVKEKGMAAGRWAVKIRSLIFNRQQKGLLTGKGFPKDEKNKKLFWQWWRLSQKEHFLIFLLSGFLTIVLLAILAKTLVFGFASPREIEFLYQEAGVIGQRLGSIFGLLFLVVAGVMLYSTQIGVLESSSRIISENLALAKNGLAKKVNLALYFYLALWGQILLGIILLSLGFTQPRFLLTLSAVLNALAMTVCFPLIWYLNRRRLDKEFQMGGVRKLIFLLATAFFVFFDLKLLK